MLDLIEPSGPNQTQHDSLETLQKKKKRKDRDVEYEAEFDDEDSYGESIGSSDSDRSDDDDGVIDDVDDSDSSDDGSIEDVTQKYIKKVGLPKKKEKKKHHHKHRHEPKKKKAKKTVPRDAPPPKKRKSPGPTKMPKKTTTPSPPQAKRPRGIAAPNRKFGAYPPVFMKRAQILTQQIENGKTKLPKDIVTILVEEDQKKHEGAAQQVDIASLDQQLFDAICIMVASYPIDRFKKRAAELVKNSPHPDEWPEKDFGPMNTTPALINSFNLIYARFAKNFGFPVPTDPNEFIL